MIILFSACAFFAWGQNASKLIGTWRQAGLDPQTFSRIGIVVFSPKMNTRATVEEKFEEAFQAKKVNGIGTFDVFPLAGQPEIFEGVSEEEIQTRVKNALDKFGMTGLLTIAVFDIQQEERYKAGPSFTVSAPVYSAPAYGYNYYQYFTYATATVSRPGYYETSSTYFLEYNLYDVQSDQLIWSAQSQTRDPKELDREAERMAKKVVKQLLKEEVLKKP